MVNPIPDSYPRISTYICVDGAADAIDFYKSVFGFTERRRMDFGGRVGHCELALGDSLIMVSDEFPEMDVVGPKTLGGSPMALNMYVEDVDAVCAAAVAAGATELRPIEQQFYGDRSGQILDPWGHRWSVATHTEDVDDAEIERRATEMMSGAEH